MTNKSETCGARRPGWEHGPAWGRKRLPCILEDGHGGQHANAFGDTWGDHDVPDHPHREACREASKHAPARVDAEVRELTTILAHPGHPAHAAIRMKQADRLFSAIDRHMRDGGTLPHGWHDAPASGDALEAVTEAYDALSEVLRERGGVVASRRALLDAAMLWEVLTAALNDGSPLPEPWQRASGPALP